MKQIILALMLAVAGIGAAVAANPIREGNMISGHVLVKGSEENIVCHRFDCRQRTGNSVQ